MDNEKMYPSVKLDWGKVSWLVGQMISEILGREVRCRSGHDDYDYWSVTAVTDRFSLRDMKRLLDAVGADGATRLEALAFDSQDTTCLDMALSRALLRKNLRTTWERDYTAEDGLWLLGVDEDSIDLPEPDNSICFIDSIAVELRTLWPKDELIARLFEDGGTVGRLSELCARYVKLYGNELYWGYPITDGQYNGVYFVMVQEGILCLPYYEIDKECFEMFEHDGARLVTAEDMKNFIADWERMSNCLTAAMKSLYNYLKERKRKWSYGTAERSPWTAT